MATACAFVETAPAECHTKPCASSGDKSLFDQPTAYQPEWSEPRVTSLIAKMLDAFQGRQSMQQLPRTREIIQQYAAEQTWHDVGNLLAQRVEMLLLAKRQASRAP